MSKKTNKYFPADFFDEVEKNRTIKTGDLSNNSRYNKKNEIEMFKDYKPPHQENNYAKESNSPTYSFKKNQFEMIPEDEDDKFNTLYDKKNQQYHSKDENNNANENHFFSNMLFKDKLPFIDKLVVNADCQTVQKISSESSLNEFHYKSNEISKNKDNIRKVSSNIRKIRIRNDNRENDNPIVENINYKVSNLMISGDANSKQTGSSSPSRFMENKEYKNIENIAIDNIQSDGELEITKKEHLLPGKYSETIDSKKSFDRNHVKLPLIKSSRPTFETKIDNKQLSKIFQACTNLQKDPEIKEKLSELISKIVDLKNVINSKSSSRFKISSAPTQNLNTDNKFIFNSKTNTFNNKDNITFSKFPKFDKKTISINESSLHFSSNMPSNPSDKYNINNLNYDLKLKQKPSNNSLGPLVNKKS